MQPFTLFDFQQGIDHSREDWLIPEGAFAQMNNAYINRGFINARQGYVQYATGGKGSAATCESRMVSQTSGASMTGAIDSANTTYTSTLTGPVRRGTVVVTGSTPSQTATDDGLGGFTGDVSAGTINYTTGAVSVTFNTAPTGGTVTVTYDTHPGLAVMMVANFYTDAQVRQLIVADTRNVNRYNSTTNRLDDISGGTTYTGDTSNFWAYVNYPDSSDANRLLFTNNVDVIQQYEPSGGVADYSPTITGVTNITCLRIHQFKDRLILLNIDEDGTRFPKRIRISGYGSNTDVFDTSAPGAGIIELSDDSDIVSSWQNRDDLLIFTNRSVWVMKYTGNDVVPFELQKIDGTRGADAPFGTNDYLNNTTYVSRRGIFVTDGYRTEKADNVIPNFVYDEIDASYIDLCYSGREDEDEVNYLLYPEFDADESTGASDKILVTNYTNLSYSIYDIALSTLGQFKESFDVTWADLIAPEYQNWNSLSARFNTWKSFSYMLDSEMTIGGGHNGQIWRLNKGDGVDNDVLIRGITKASSAVVTTDYNDFSVGDKVYFTGVQGMLDINGMVGTITTAGVNSVTVDIDSTDFETYTSDTGVISRVIPLEIESKQFNPFFERGKGARVGWANFYYNVGGQSVYEKELRTITDISVSSGVVTVTSPGSNFSTGDRLYIYNVSGATEANDQDYTITSVTSDTFTLDDTDGSSWTAYTSGGKIKKKQDNTLDVQIKVGDVEQLAQDSSGQIISLKNTMVNRPGVTQNKMWKRFPINQSGNFVQLRITNEVPISNVRIHCIQLGMQPSQRLKDS